MKYWNPYLETLPREEFNRIELSYFRNILSHAKTHSALYREKLHDIDPKDLRTLDDIKKIPLTQKEEMRKYQEMEPFPYGGLLGRDISEVTTFRQTSGTTGKPIYVPETYESWQWRIEVWCHILYMAGFRPHHRAFCPLATMSMSPSGRPIMPRKRSAVNLSPEGPSTPKEGFIRSWRSGPMG